MPAAPLFSVLLASHDDFKLGSIVQSLAAYKHAPVADGTFQAKHCWGIVAENLSEEEADRLTQCLTQNQLKSLKVNSASVVRVPDVQFLTLGSMTPEALVGADLKKQPVEILRNQICVISASVLTSTSLKTIRTIEGPTATQQLMSFGIMMATGLPISIGGKKKTVEKTLTQTELFFYLTVITKEPFKGYRFLADNFNYSYLKEKKLYNAMGNFKMLLADLQTTAPSAKLSRGANILLANQPVSAMNYEALTDINRECSWLLSLP